MMASHETFAGVQTATFGPGFHISTDGELFDPRPARKDQSPARLVRVP